MQRGESRWTRALQTLGPGILFASTAIGVSHLVQCTRAGADYGFAMLWAVIAANLFKYPFFEFGSRYANATGESLIDGYRRIGRWMLVLYAVITVVSMVFVSSAVGAVTSGFLQSMFGIDHWGIWVTGTLFAICVALLFLGSYAGLDSLIKIIGSVLLVCTVVAFSLALHRGPELQIPDFVPHNPWDAAGIAFLIALMGWMPTAVDLSAWNSLWTLERISQTRYRPTMRETLTDFNIGYVISSILAILFMTLGAYMLYGTGTELPNGSAAFAASVVGIYTNYIGEWSRWIIGVASFCIMFGTCIAVFDGYARSFQRVFELFFLDKKVRSQHVYRITLVVTAMGAFAIIALFAERIKTLVDLSTTLSFLVAPVIAVVNLRLVTWREMPTEHRPPLWLRVLAWFGIMFLSGFAVFFVFT